MILRNNKNQLHITDLILSFTPVLIAICLQYLTVIGDIIVLFFKNLFSDEKTVSTRLAGTILTQDYNQPMNQAYILLARYVLYIIVFGIWYYKTFVKNDDFKLKPLTLVLMIPMGISAQIVVDAVLVLARPCFPHAFSGYDTLVQNVTGAGASFVMTLAIMIIAPIGEELLFRGVMFKYFCHYLSTVPAIAFQALIFGIYHGNIIQGIYAFLLGILLGAVYQRTGSVIPCIALHMSINISFFFIPEILFATVLRTIIAGVAGLLLLILCIFFALKKHNSGT